MLSGLTWTSSIDGVIGTDDSHFLRGDSLSLGVHVITLQGTDSDGNTSVDSVTIAVVLPVRIDIKPGSSPNCVNLTSEGIVPVAIRGSETFDVTTIDPATIRFMGAKPNQKGKSGRIGSFEDVNDDGFMDFLVHFITQELEMTSDTTDGTLTGGLLNGASFSGSDSVCVVPKK